MQTILRLIARPIVARHECTYVQHCKENAPIYMYYVAALHRKRLWCHQSSPIVWTSRPPIFWTSLRLCSRLSVGQFVCMSGWMTWLIAWLCRYPGWRRHSLVDLRPRFGDGQFLGPLVLIGPHLTIYRVPNRNRYTCSDGKWGTRSCGDSKMGNRPLRRK